MIAVADAYDSMVSHRAYRPSLSSDEALKIIEERAGTQFDPALVKLFKDILPDALKEVREYEEKMKFKENIHANVEVKTEGKN